MPFLQIVISKLEIAGHAVRNFLASIPDKRIRFFLLIGMVLWTSINFILHSEEPTLNTRTYDNQVRQRWFTPEPDPDILIVDIDEASLAYMSKDFGRWPWPRDTLAATLIWLEQQGAKAVLFDILFSDADQLNKAADASFADAIAQSNIAYFPVLRLNPENDKVSHIHASHLKGFASPIITQITDPPLAVVTPLFESAVASERLGYHNVYGDRDGVLRHYRYWEDKDGWRIWSLPARLAQDQGWGLPPQANPLTNWNKKRLEHITIPFKDIWQLSQSRAGQTPDERFAGKIVLIGATATSLFDVKTTPISTIHPGIDVLATAIDNAKNHRYLLQVPPWGELVFTFVALSLMFMASTRLSPKKIKWAIVVAPTLLVGVSFITLQFGHWYLDPSIPASQAFIFFGLLGTFRAKRQNHWSKSQVLGTRGHTQAWAIRTAENFNASDLLDALTPCKLSLCLQSLVWQRQTDHSDTELWIIRIAAATPAQLEVGATQVFKKLENLLDQSKVTAITAEPAKPFAILPPPPSKKRWPQLQLALGLAPVEHNFASQDRRLASHALAINTPDGHSTGVI